MLSLERFRAVDMTFEGRSKSSIMDGLARSVAGWRVVRLLTRPNDPLTIDRRSTTGLISRVKPRDVSCSGLLCDGSCLRRLKCQLTRDDRRPTVRPAWPLAWPVGRPGSRSRTLGTDRWIRPLVHRSLSGISPSYLADDCRLVADARERRLRSTASRTCVVTWTYIIQCESKKNPPPPRGPDIFLFFTNGWEFLIYFLHTYYTFLSTIDYKFLFNYPRFWRTYAILSATTQCT